MSFRLMCITAHPDDESGAFGGALFMAHTQGVETSVICLTDGQAASNRGAAASAEELAAKRRAEFEGAGAVLGVTHGEVLHYPDGELPEQNFYEIAGVLVERIRRLRPQVVLTWGGEGGLNLHRDHTITSALATAAFHWAGRSTFWPEQIEGGLRAYAPQKLYYSTIPFFVSRSPKEASLAPRTTWSLCIEAENLKEKKLEAFRKHETQAVLLEKHRDIIDKVIAREYYLLVAARNLREASSDKYVFDGVAED